MIDITAALQEKTIGKLNRALGLARDISDKESQKKIYLQFADFYEQIGNTKKAYQFYKKYSKINNELYSENSHHKIVALQVRLANIKQKSNLKALEEYKAKTESSIKWQQYITIFMVSIASISVIFLIILIVQFRVIKKREQLVQEQYKLKESAIKKLKIAYSELEKNEERFKTMVQNMPILINAIGENNLFVLWNKEAERITGFSSDEMINNKEALSYLYPDKGTEKMIFDEFGKNIDYYNKETIIKCKDQSIKTISWSNISSSIFIKGWKEWAIGIDVSQQKSYERSLIHEKAILNSIIDSIPFIIFYKDMEGRYIGFNKSFLQHNNLEASDILGKTDYDLYPKKLADFFINIDKSILKNDSTWRAEKWEKTADKGLILLSSVKSCFKDQEGNILGIIGISRDITDTHNFAEVLKKEKEKAEESDQLKSAFLANMSHEIRTPMNAIIGFSELLSESKDLPDKLKPFVNHILSSGENLLHLINDIVDIAKIEANQLKISKTNFDVFSILDELNTTYTRIIDISLKKELKIVVETPEDVKSIQIHSDPYRLKQVLTNFLSNALKFTKKGTITLGVKMLKDYQLLFYVRDTGIGIPKDKLQLVFDRFRQIENNYSKLHEGTGLGLAISKSIVHLLGGEIFVKSVENEGSSFSFNIKYFSIGKISNKSVQELSTSQKQTKEYDWSGKNFLIAEDDHSNYELLKSLLEKTKVTIFHASNGKEAVEITLKSKIDFVLMDIQMPLMNGIDAIKSIRETKPDLPIICQTAFAIHGEREKCKEVGSNDYLSKPISKEELYMLIEKYI